MCNLIVSTAKSYPNILILIREHPEYRGKTKKLLDIIHCQNIHIVNNDKLTDVYAQTKVVVSHFSSTLMEGIMYGCTPLIFNPTPNSSYYPDIEKEKLGFISKNEEEFFYKLPYCLCRRPIIRYKQWFKAYGKETINYIIEVINNILSK